MVYLFVAESGDGDRDLNWGLKSGSMKWWNGDFSLDCKLLKCAMVRKSLRKDLRIWLWSIGNTEGTFGLDVCCENIVLRVQGRMGIQMDGLMTKMHKAMKKATKKVKTFKKTKKGQSTYSPGTIEKTFEKTKKKVKSQKPQNNLNKTERPKKSKDENTKNNGKQ